MYVRLGSFQIKPGTLDALRTTYNTKCVGVVRKAPGNVDCFLLEPVDDAPCVVCTMWETEADAVRYEASGTAGEIVAKVREFFAGPPKLESYRVTRPVSAVDK